MVPGIDVVVVGGGVAGLAAASALARSGRRVRLVEKASEFGEIGAGLQLGPNATRILAEWGLLDRVIASGVLPARLVLRDARDGHELTALDLDEGFRQRYGGPYVVTHRSDLHGILLDAAAAAGVDLRTDSEVVAVRFDTDSATTTLASGAELVSRVVVGADGLHSRLRSVISDDAPVPSGYVAYRGTVSATEVEHAGSDDVIGWIGPDCHLVQYPLRRYEILNQVAVFRSPRTDSAASEWGGPDELDAAFARCCAPVRSALGNLRRDRRWPMSDREPLARWSRDRLLLIGDAAHPMLQYLAQGACQAIEDARELTRAIGDGPLDTTHWRQAVEIFHERRAPRTMRIQAAARWWGDLWHCDGRAAALRNAYLRDHDSTIVRHIDWLYGAQKTAGDYSGIKA